MFIQAAICLIYALGLDGVHSHNRIHNRNHKVANDSRAHVHCVHCTEIDRVKAVERSIRFRFRFRPDDILHF